MQQPNPKGNLHTLGDDNSQTSDKNSELPQQQWEIHHPSDPPAALHRGGQSTPAFTRNLLCYSNSGYINSEFMDAASTATFYITATIRR